jgi:hypothetical protein
MLPEIEELTNYLRGLICPLYNDLLPENCTVHSDNFAG